MRGKQPEEGGADGLREAARGVREYGYCGVGVE